MPTGLSLLTLLRHERGDIVDERVDNVLRAIFGPRQVDRREWLRKLVVERLRAPKVGRKLRLDRVNQRRREQSD